MRLIRTIQTQSDLIRLIGLIQTYSDSLDQISSDLLRQSNWVKLRLIQTQIRLIQTQLNLQTHSHSSRVNQTCLDSRVWCSWVVNGSKMWRTEVLNWKDWLLHSLIRLKGGLQAVIHWVTSSCIVFLWFCVMLSALSVFSLSLRVSVNSLEELWDVKSFPESVWCERLTNELKNRSTSLHSDVLSF